METEQIILNSQFEAHGQNPNFKSKSVGKVFETQEIF